MSNHKCLIELIKQHIQPSQFLVTDGEIEENEKYICKLAIKGTSSNPEIDMEGNIINRSCLLLVNVQSDSGVKGYDDGWDFCEQLEKDITKIIHKSYKDTDGVFRVAIDNIRLRGSINKIGLNPQAIYCFSINFIVNYVTI